ncbi:hypothetical protein HU200_057628 [Digitaria exilis]|uniref:DUF295 domain-containing protein n=1 Tax=Digitaria exilis TaxID=1010633 RepID=A0A835E2P2_9POAL|nr:hypothetical protein HU200_057628 [Digitaria exilis]
MASTPAGNDNQQQHCDLFPCFCCWRRRFSIYIPCVVPGQDYTSASVASHNLRLHRFHVAGSGRVIGRSDDLLEPFCGKHERPGILMLEDCKIATGPDFYFICQADQHSLVYRISTSGAKLTCHEKALEALLCLDTARPGDVAEYDPPSWYFVHHELMLHVIPSSPDCGHYIVDVEKKSYKLHKSKRSKLFFSAVFRAGKHIVALCENLQYVYMLRNNLQWRRQKTASSSIDLARKVKVSGFADLVDVMFIVSDNSTADSFMFDLKRGEWFTNEKFFGLLNGRCIFAEGFIYTCSDECLLAFELIADNASYRLGVPIVLDFSWKYICGNKRFLSFDSISWHEIGVHIVFCVVQGYDLAPPGTSRHTLATTKVQVELVDTAPGKKEPVGIGHVNIALSSIIHEGWILTNYAFSL